jgi:RND family efflux transporter MFP subunit
MIMANSRQFQLVLLGLGLLGVAACDQGPAKAIKNPKVEVTQPITCTVIDYQDFTGRLEAVKTIDIRARVSGYVTQVPFKEGDLVKEGDLLFQIDVRPYEADVNQAEANLKVGIAERNLQAKNAERARKLPPEAMSKEEFETIHAAELKSAAAVGALQAARDRAKLYLDYTRVTSPVTGRVSRRFIDPGNLINADTTVLTTVVTENPMYAYFDVDERTYLDLLTPNVPPQSAQHANSQQPDFHPVLQLPVLMRLANETEFDKVGRVNFVDNRVIATTGTIRMRGVFDNAAGLLKAGLFVRIRLPMAAPYQALVIPDEAILSDQERKYVWVVNAKKEVEYRSVKIGQAIHDLRVIRPPTPGQEGKEGLSVGESVIIAGMQRVRKGNIVDATPTPPPAPPDVPLVRLWNRGQAVK